MKNKRLITAGRTLDHAAGIYDAVTNLTSLGRSSQLRAEAIAYMDFEPEDHVVDLGCGTVMMTL